MVKLEDLKLNLIDFRWLRYYCNGSLEFCFVKKPCRVRNAVKAFRRCYYKQMVCRII